MPAAVDHARAIQSDGIHYYAFLRSALFDRDLDSANDYALLGSDYKGPNVLPVGAPLLWAPFVSLVHLAREAARGLRPASRPSGNEPVYAAAVCLASFAYGAAGLFLLLRILRRFAAPARRLLGHGDRLGGLALRFYMSVLPSLAHACEFFAAVLVLGAWLDLRAASGGGTGPGAPAWPAASSSSCARRTACCSCSPVSCWGRGLLRPRAFGPRGGHRLLPLACGFALARLPQFLVWQAQFGVPFLVPHKKLHGAAFFHAAQPELWGALFSPRGGLFVTYPALLVALLGVLALAAGQASSAEGPDGEAPPSAPVPGFDALYLLCLLPVLLAAWWLNASIFDWYQVRRYTGLVPFLAPGLALVLSPLGRAGSLPLALVAFLAWRYDDAVDARRNNPGDPVPVRMAVVTVADRLAADGYALAEPWAPRPAVRLLAAYTGEPVLEGNVTYVDLVERRGPPAPAPARPVPFRPRGRGRPARAVGERTLRAPLRSPRLARPPDRAPRGPGAGDPRAAGPHPRMERSRGGLGRHGARVARVLVERTRGSGASGDERARPALRARAPLLPGPRGRAARDPAAAALRWLTLNRAGPASP